MKEIEKILSWEFGTLTALAVLTCVKECDLNEDFRAKYGSMISQQIEELRDVSSY